MSKKSVPKKEVKDISEISRVRITQDEIEECAGQFEEILERFSRLDSVDVDSETGATDLRSSVRPDITQSSENRSQHLEQASETKDGYFVGPSVREDD